MQISDLTLILYYPVCAGGKFIINSLGLSKYCTLHDYGLAKWDCDQTAHDQLYYQTKLSHVLATVPINKNSGDWINYEMGNTRQLLTPGQFQIAAADITKRQQYFCIIAHSREDLEEIKNITHSKNIIKLTNFSKWMRVSSFKHQETANDIDNKVVASEYTDQKEINNEDWWHIVDIDQGVGNKLIMQQQIEDLYTKLKWDDFDTTVWSQYYQQYIQSHNWSQPNV
jgi:hypothetical protein